MKTSKEAVGFYRSTMLSGVQALSIFPKLDDHPSMILIKLGSRNHRGVWAEYTVEEMQALLAKAKETQDDVRQG